MRRFKAFKNCCMAFALFLGLSIVLSACATPAKGPAATAPASGPKYGGTLRVAIPVKPTSLDSMAAGSVSVGSTAVMKTFMQGLPRFSGKNDMEAKAAPLMAKSWEVSPDGLTWTFHLQEGVKWQNVPPVNGREFTATDFKYHFDRMMDPATKFAGRTTYDIKSTEVVDKYTLKVTTNSKSPGFLAFIISAPAAPIPKEVVEAPGGAAKNWVGTGPFILTELDPNVKAVFKRNPDYWDKGKPYLDTVEFYFMTDPATRLAAFRSNQLDILPSEGKKNRDDIARTVQDVQIQDNINMLECGLLFNNSKKPFDNKLVRQAIQYAIDYDGLISAALDGAGMRHGYLAPWLTDWGAKPVDQLPKRDVVKAKALLAQAGYADGFSTTILQNTGMMDFSGNAVEPIVAMLKDVGIDAKIVQTDTVGWVSKWRSGDFDMTVGICMTGRPVDPDNSLRQQWPSKASYNQSRYNNPKVDELIIAEQNAFPDKDKRVKIIRQILDILEDDVPNVPLYITTSYCLTQPWVKGWDNTGDPHGSYGVQGIPYTWIDK